MKMLYYAYNDTNDRIPLADWFDTITAQQIAFIARPNVAAYWFKVYLKSIEKKTTITT